jgi:hypothetical protein
MITSATALIDELICLDFLIFFHIERKKIFPPHKAINDYLMSGGFDHGMSGGATWIPFTIDHDEYQAVKNSVQEEFKVEFIEHPYLEKISKIEHWIRRAGIT